MPNPELSNFQNILSGSGWKTVAQFPINPNTCHYISGFLTGKTNQNSGINTKFLFDGIFSKEICSPTGTALIPVFSLAQYSGSGVFSKNNPIYDFKFIESGNNLYLQAKSSLAESTQLTWSGASCISGKQIEPKIYTEYGSSSEPQVFNYDFCQPNYFPNIRRSGSTTLIGNTAGYIVDNSWNIIQTGVSKTGCNLYTIDELWTWIYTGSSPEIICGCSTLYRKNFKIGDIGVCVSSSNQFEITCFFRKSGETICQQNCNITKTYNILDINNNFSSCTLTRPSGTRFTKLLGSGYELNSFLTSAPVYYEDVKSGCNCLVQANFYTGVLATGYFGNQIIFRVGTFDSCLDNNVNFCESFNFCNSGSYLSNLDPATNVDSFINNSGRIADIEKTQLIHDEITQTNFKIGTGLFYFASDGQGSIYKKKSNFANNCYMVLFPYRFTDDWTGSNSGWKNSYYSGDMDCVVASRTFFTTYSGLQFANQVDVSYGGPEGPLATNRNPMYLLKSKISGDSYFIERIPNDSFAICNQNINNLFGQYSTNTISKYGYNFVTQNLCVYWDESGKICYELVDKPYATNAILTGGGNLTGEINYYAPVLSGCCINWTTREFEATGNFGYLGFNAFRNCDLNIFSITGHPTGYICHHDYSGQIGVPGTEIYYMGNLIGYGAYQDVYIDWQEPMHPTYQILKYRILPPIFSGISSGYATICKKIGYMSQFFNDGAGDIYVQNVNACQNIILPYTDDSVFYKKYYFPFDEKSLITGENGIDAAALNIGCGDISSGYLQIYKCLRASCYLPILAPFNEIFTNNNNYPNKIRCFSRGEMLESDVTSNFPDFGQAQISFAQLFNDSEEVVSLETFKNKIYPTGDLDGTSNLWIGKSKFCDASSYGTNITNSIFEICVTQEILPTETDFNGCFCLNQSFPNLFC